MFVKIELHEIPPFFVSSELENEVIKNMVTEFEKDRSQYGYKNLTLKEKYNTKKEFCKRFNLKIEHDSIISLEIYKQGRTRRWLHDRIKEDGHTLSYISMCQKITGYGFMPLKLKKSIYNLLKIH
jgi:hypothetical protein